MLDYELYSKDNQNSYLKIIVTLFTKINRQIIMITALLICKFAPIFELPNVMILIESYNKNN